MPLNTQIPSGVALRCCGGFETPTDKSRFYNAKCENTNGNMGEDGEGCSAWDGWNVCVEARKCVWGNAEWCR